MTTARWFYDGRRATPNLVVAHSLEYPEWVTSAEDALRYFQTTDRKASVHAVVDSDSVTRPVDDEDTAFGAAGVNSRALHVEHAGYAAQTGPEWVDPYGLAMLPRSAKVVAGWCRKYAIPPVRLTVEQVRAGVPGICSHYDVSRAFPDVSTGHTDPGDGFPWDYYLGLVRAELEDDMTPEDKAWIKGLVDALDAKIEAGRKDDRDENVKQLRRVCRWVSGLPSTVFTTENVDAPTPLSRAEATALHAETGGSGASAVADGTYKVTRVGD